MRNIIANKRMNAYEVLENFKDILNPSQAPIELDSLLDALNINLNNNLEIENLNNTGYIEVKDNNIKIWVNPLKNNLISRERFTIAHELGHLFLHIAPENKNAIFKDTEETLKRNSYWNIKEYEANNFAAQLLMPKDLILKEGKAIIELYKEQYNDLPYQEDFIKMMAEKFNVSKLAMKYRLKNLGAIK